MALDHVHEDVLPVIIIGAGVGGLAHAQGLKRQGIPFIVFERDALLDSRLQGYRLKIFSDMAAKLQVTLTEDAWAAVEATSARSPLGETNLNATDASVTACRRGRPPPGASRPLTVDRGLLRAALMTGIEDSVRFGKVLASYELLEDGKSIRALFTDGSSEVGSLLVGADGSNSVVRKQFFPSYKFLDTGACCVYGKSSLTAELQASFPEKHRRWITVVRDETPTIEKIIAGDSPVTMVCEPCYFTNRDKYPHLPEDYVHWGIMFRRELLGLGSEELERALKNDPAALALEITAEWAVSIRSLIEQQNHELTYGMRVLSAPATIPEWQTSDRVTLLGDAVHVMSPSGGVGAVAALNDACLLTQTLAEGGISLEGIRRYENGMRQFAGQCIRRSNVAGTSMLGFFSTE